MSFGRSTLLLLFVLLVATQSAESQFGFRQLIQTGYSHIGTDFWASGGAGIAERGVAGASLANPALLSFDTPTARVKFSWRPSTDYHSWITYEYDNTLALPSYASVGIPIGSYNVEAGYARTYNERLSLPDVEYITYTQVGGTLQTNHTGQYVDITNTVVVHTAFAAGSYTLPQGISVGLMVGEDFIRYESSSISTAVQTASRLRLSIGGVARPWKNVALGLNADIIPKNYTGTSSVPFPAVTQAPITPSASAGPPLVMIYPSPYFSWQSPSTLEVGSGVDILPWLTLLGSVKYQIWSSGIDLADRWQFHAGGSATVISGITVRAGFFTETSASVGENDYLDEDFLTAGVWWRISPNISASVSYMTSEPFVGNVRWVSFKSLNQEILSGGISYSW